MHRLRDRLASNRRRSKAEPRSLRELTTFHRVFSLLFAGNGQLLLPQTNEQYQTHFAPGEGSVRVSVPGRRLHIILQPAST
jgi:hypothetical protein